jgi:hypothetical protein
LPAGFYWPEGDWGRVLRRYFGLRGEEQQETGENCIMRSFVNCADHRILLGRPNGGCDGRGMWHVWEGKYYRLLAGRSGRKRPNKRPNLRWDYKIIVHLNEKENVGRGLA